jgi:hypothetical protein
MKKDEIVFLLTYYEMSHLYGLKDYHDFSIRPRHIINFPFFKDFMHNKRAWYLLNKWSRKWWYEYGTTLDMGWLTDEGISKAQELYKELK